MKHYRCNMEARDWQLYSESMDCDEVADILNASFNVLARDTYRSVYMYSETSKSNKEVTAESAIMLAENLQKNMRTVMSVWSRYGAYDSEPDGMLAYEIGKCHEHYLPHIELEVGRFGIREKGSDDYI